MPVKNHISWKIINNFTLSNTINIFLNHKVMKNESGRLINVSLKSWHFTLINGVLSELLKTFKIKKFVVFDFFQLNWKYRSRMFCEKVEPFLHYTDTPEIKFSYEIVYCCVCSNCKVSCHGKTCHYFFTKAAYYLGISDLSWKCFRSVSSLYLDIESFCLVRFAHACVDCMSFWTSILSWNIPTD